MKKTTLLFAILLLANTLSHAQSVTLATTTANPTKGTVYFNNSTNQLQYWNGSAWVSLTNTPGTGWALSGTNIYKTNAGNVGIGTSTPSLPFVVKIGNKGITQENLDGSIQVGFYTNSNSAYVQTHTNHDLRFSTNNDPTQMILQKGTGFIGIGDSSPTNRVQIGSVGSTGYIGNDIAIGTGNAAMGIAQTDSYTQIGSTTPIIFRPENNTGGIGINLNIGELPRGPLDVRFLGTSGTTNYAYFMRGGDGQPFLGSSNSDLAPVSIFAQTGVLANQFIAVSDKRIKNIVGISNSKEDLAIIKSLEITDYTMKDQLQHGNKPFKKVIAQQVEEVYPQAISKITDVVPDIYVLAEKVVYDKLAKTLICTLPKNYDIKAGEKLQFIHPTVGKIKAEVIEVSCNSFTVKDWQHATDKIFVYGHEVNDFRSVDYEAISMLGISAIQQLAKENEELKAKSKETDRKFEQLSARLQALEATLEVKVPTGK